MAISRARMMLDLVVLALIVLAVYYLKIKDGEMVGPADIQSLLGMG